MRMHHVFAVVAVVLVGAGIKIFLTTPTAEADLLFVKSAGLEIAQLHQSNNLPVENSHDFSLTFPGP